MKVRVDPAKCMGHGQCNLYCPQIFTIDERGYNNVVEDRDVPEALSGAARMAANSCPENAITTTA